MKLHWSPRSPFVRKVMVSADEIGVAGELECVRTPVAIDVPNLDLIKDNPLLKIPTLVLDDGLALFDSTVICEYLDTLHSGPKLIPASGRERLMTLQQQSFADGLLDVMLLLRLERNKPLEQQRPQWLASFELKVRASLEALERIAPTLHTDILRLDDIAIAVTLAHLDFRLADIGWRDGHPRLTAWYAEVAARPSMQRTQPFDDR